MKDARTYYVQTGIQLNGKRTLHKMHQLLLGVGADHRDHNGLNNRRSNLRLATTEQNGSNRQKDKRAGGALSLDKGVTLRSGVAERFEAHIRVNGKAIYLGRFDSEIQAYDTAARKYFGEFAAVNFPQPGGTGCDSRYRRHTRGGGAMNMPRHNGIIWFRLSTDHTVESTHVPVFKLSTRSS
jgi:HNH endonuclease